MRTNPSPNSSSAGAKVTPLLSWRASAFGASLSALGAGFCLTGLVLLFLSAFNRRVGLSDENRLLLALFAALVVYNAREIFSPLRYEITPEGLRLPTWPRRRTLGWTAIVRVELTPRAAKIETAGSFWRGPEALILPRDPALRAEALALLRGHLPETAFAQP